MIFFRPRREFMRRSIAKAAPGRSAAAFEPLERRVLLSTGSVTITKSASGPVLIIPLPAGIYISLGEVPPIPYYNDHGSVNFPPPAGDIVTPFPGLASSPRATTPAQNESVVTAAEVARVATVFPFGWNLQGHIADELGTVTDVIRSLPGSAGTVSTDDYDLFQAN
jgi:hypothetical protein